MKKICWTLAFLTYALALFPQVDSLLHIPKNVLSWGEPNYNPDSLKNLLTQVSGEEEVLILCRISQTLFQKNDDAAIDYCNKALLLSDSLNYNPGKVMAYIILSAYVVPKSDFRKRLQFLQEAEKNLDKETHWSLKYRVWIGIGGNYKDLGIADSAIVYFSKPLNELNCDTAWIACLNADYWLGIKAKYDQDYEKELEFITKTFDITMQHPEYRYFVRPNYFCAPLERLVSFYTQQGSFKKSVISCHTILDSLRNWDFIPAAVKPYIYAKYLGHLARAYHHWGKLDSAIIYHDSAMVFFNRTLHEYPEIKENKYPYPNYADWEINLANQLEEKSGVLIKKGNLTKAEADLLESVKLRSQNNDLLGMAMSLDKLGELYAMKGNFTLALSHYDSAIILKNKFHETYNNKNICLSTVFLNDVIKESISYTYLKTGDLYNAWKKPQLAQAFYLKSLKESRNIGYQKGEAEALTALGNNYLSRNLPDSAFRFFNQAQSVYKTMNNIHGLAVSLVNLGDYYLMLRNLPMAMKNLSEAQTHFETLEMPTELANIFVKQAEIYRKQRKTDDAIAHYEAALNIAIPLNLRQTMLTSHLGLSEIYEVAENTEKAFSHFKSYTRLKDELFTTETNMQIAELETRFETDKKLQKIELLEKKSELHKNQASRSKIILFAVSGLTVVSLLWLLVYLRQNRLKNEHEKSQLQQKLLRSQLNPHFIFNSLSTVQNSIINEQPALANQYLSRFSKLMRNILDSSTIETIPVEEELYTIVNYLALQKIRYGDKFDYQIDVDESIDTSGTALPPMLAQPFIENSIEHGFRQKETKGMIWIRFRPQENYLVLEIEDNGIGRKSAGEFRAKDKKDYKSMATFLTQERIMLINKGKKRKISMEITDLMSSKGTPEGTLVKFHIPV